MRRRNLVVSLLLEIILTSSYMVYAQSLVWKQEVGIGDEGWSGDVTGMAADSEYLYIVGYTLKDKYKIEQRYKSDGNVVWEQELVPATNYDSVEDVACDDTGIYIVGIDNSIGLLDRQWRIEKRKKDGMKIWDQLSNPTNKYDVAKCVTVDGSAVYIAGLYRVIPSTTDSGWRIEKRDKTNGSLEKAVEHNIGVGEGSVFGADSVRDMVGDTDYLYIVGQRNHEVNVYDWYVQKRKKSDLSLVWEKEIHGVEKETMDPHSVDCDTNYLYIVGIDWRTEMGWRIEKRNKSDGNEVWDKKCTPAIDINEAPGPIRVVCQGNYIYVGRFEATKMLVKRWQIEKRDKADGDVIWKAGCDDGGYSNYSRKFSLVCDNVSLYMAGVYARAEIDDNYFWRIEKWGLEEAVYEDCGLRIYDGNNVVTIACEPQGTLTSPLRIRTRTDTYGIVLVDTDDPNASAVRIRVSSTETKALRALP